MSFALLRSSVTARRAVSTAVPAVFARGKATLPDLKYDFGALEPAISGQIMEVCFSFSVFFSIKN